MNKNRLLAALPDNVYKSLRPYLKPVELEKGQVLFESGEVIQKVYFPTDAIISLLNTTEEGWSVQLALIGKEGILGIGGLLETESDPYRVVVQIPGGAQEMSLEVFKRAWNRHTSLRRLMSLHLHSTPHADFPNGYLQLLSLSRTTTSAAITDFSRSNGDRSPSIHTRAYLPFVN